MNKFLHRRLVTLLAAAVLSLGAASLAQDSSQNSGAPGRGSRNAGSQGGGQRGGGSGADLDVPPPTNPTGPAKAIKPIAGEQFFIIASIDQNKQELLLKRPTEVTTLMKTSNKTVFLDEMGRTITLADFRAGDTVWVASTGEKSSANAASAASGSEATAIRIRKGQMTVAELHKTYLDYAEIK